MTGRPGWLRTLVHPPNVVTLVRLPLAALPWVAPGSTPWVALLIALAALSDLLDGWLARRIRARVVAAGGDLDLLDRAERTGSWLDPLCDKAFVLSLLLAETMAHRPPWFAPLLIATREVLIVPLVLAHRLSRHHAQRPIDYRARISGKLCTVAQFAALVALVLEHAWLVPLAVVAAALSVVTTVDYVARAAREVGV